MRYVPYLICGLVILVAIGLWRVTGNKVEPAFFIGIGIILMIVLRVSNKT